MQLYFGRWRFKPGLIPTLVTVILFPLFISLGMWQLDRASQKHQLKNEFERRLQKPYRDIEQLKDVGMQTLRYHKVELEGQYDNKQQFIHDNRTYKGVAGYHILTPFYSKSLKKAILVNRGWVQQNSRRAVLPDIDVDEEYRRIKGIINIPAAAALVLGKEQISTNWPRRIQNIDITVLEEQLGYPLVPYIIWLAAEESDGFVRAWKPIYSQPEKSTAYAVQWFSFAGILLLLYIVLNTRSIKPEK